MRCEPFVDTFFVVHHAATDFQVRRPAAFGPPPPCRIMRVPAVISRAGRMGHFPGCVTPLFGLLVEAAQADRARSAQDATRPSTRYYERGLFGVPASNLL